MNVDSEIVLVEGRTYEAPRVAKRDLSTVRSSEVVPWAWDGDHRAAKGLGIAPFRTYFPYCTIPYTLPFIDPVGKHGSRYQKQQDENTD